jgi:hypothetical protein
MTIPLTPYEKRLNELIAHARMGDLCWMTNELAVLQFQTRGKATDDLEGREALGEEAFIKALIREM